MIDGIRVDHERYGPIIGSTTMEVSMVFRGEPSLAAVFMEAQGMGEADGLRHIAAALDALSGPTHTPHRTLPSYPPEPEPEPRKRSTGRRNLQVE